MKQKTFRVISIILLLTFVLSMNAGAASVTDFSDVNQSDWFYAAVDYATTNGLFTGTSETTFSPNTSMTRSMFVTVLGRVAGVDDFYGRTESTPFIDVTQADYFFPYAVWANDNGIVTGVGNNAFNPNGEITREQMAAILFRYAEKFGYDLAFSDESYNTFTDTASVSGYAVNAMQWATAHGIINGANDNLSPHDNASRAQVAQIFFNFNKLETAEIPEPTDPPIETPDPSETEEPDTQTPDWENYNPEYVRPVGKSSVDADGGYYDYDLANEIMDQVDAMRVEHGADALLFHPKIQEWASVRAKEQLIKRSHIRPDGSDCLTVGYGLDSENLSWITNYSGSMSTQEYASNIVTGWSNSESHRLGMLKATAKLAAVSVYVKGDSVNTVHLFSTQSMYFMDYLN